MMSSLKEIDYKWWTLLWIESFLVDIIDLRSNLKLRLINQNTSQKLSETQCYILCLWIE